MHISQHLLHLYTTTSAADRQRLIARIEASLGDGTPLSIAFERLTGDVFASDAEHSAQSFTDWLASGKQDEALLAFYVALLERIDDAPPAPAPVSEPETPTLEKDDVAVTPEPEPKPRYVPEATNMPSRAERARATRIEPARPKKRYGKTIAAFAVLAFLIGGGLAAYPYVNDAMTEPKPESVVPAVPKEEPAPVAEVDETTYAWLTVKNVDLLVEPSDDAIAYVGDIGDRYEMLSETDEFVELDLNGTSAFAPIDAVTTDWKPSTLTDSTVLGFIEDNLEPFYGDTEANAFFAMNEAALEQTIGEPYAQETDTLNDYTFYTGGFFILQNDRVHAIDWTNTGITKEAFLALGEPIVETEDAVVYESDTYSLRLFVGANDQTRIRLTEKGD